MGELFAAVFFGLVSFVSPCVLPLLPGYLSLMSGYSIREISTGEASWQRVTAKTALFIGGFTAVFVTLGAAATSVGSFLNQNRMTLQTVAGWVIVALGLFVAVSAVWQPAFLIPALKDRRVEVKPSRLGALAPPVMGAAFAFGWTPCIGPFLGSALTLGANSETVGRGMLLMFFYAMGLGIPFLVSALLMTKAFAFFDGIKKHLTTISVVSGLLLALFGVVLVTDQVVILSSWISRWLPEFLQVS